MQAAKQDQEFCHSAKIRGAKGFTDKMMAREQSKVKQKKEEEDAAD